MLTLAVEVFYHRRKQRQTAGGKVVNVRPADDPGDPAVENLERPPPGPGNVIAKSVLLTPSLAFASNMPNPQEQPVKQRTRRKSRGLAAPVAPELRGTQNVSYISVYPKDYF